MAAEDVTWLTRTFEDAGFRAPEFAPSTTAAQGLAALRAAVERETAAAARRLAALSRIDAEYRALAEQQQTRLAALGIGQDDLSASGRASLRALVETADILDASSCRAAPLTASLAALSRRADESAAAARRAARARREAEARQAVAEEEAAWVETLAKTVLAEADSITGAGGTVATTRLRIAALRQKQAEYEERVAAAGPRPPTTHEAVVAKSEALEALRVREREAKARLEALSVLPSDLVLAKVRVEEKAAEVEAARREATSLMETVGAAW